MPHSNKMRCVTAFLLLVLIPHAWTQVRIRRTPSRDPAARAQAYKGLIVSLHGSIKKVSKKELLLESDENQLITVRCSKKTRFWSGNEQIKPSEIDLESPVTIEATEDTDLKLLAIEVRMGDAPKKTLIK